MADKVKQPAIAHQANQIAREIQQLAEMVRAPLDQVREEGGPCVSQVNMTA